MENTLFSLPREMNRREWLEILVGPGNYFHSLTTLGINVKWNMRA